MVRSPDVDPETPDEVTETRGFRALVQQGKERAAGQQRRLAALLDRHRNRPLVDLALRIYQRDRDAAGTIIGSAIAFRLFLFFVPLILFAVGLLGFFASFVESEDVESAGITGSLATQINAALTQPSSTRWIAVIIGLLGMATAGRALTRALVSANCLAWQLPVQTRSSIRLIGAISGLIVGMGIVGTVVNKLRHELGLAAVGISFIAVVAIYLAAAFLLGFVLPRGTPDPGALLPGAALIALTLAGLQAISQLYLPGRFERASELYGTIGATVVTLGWFFFAGRVIVFAAIVDAAVFERFGSISGPIFRLPVLRSLARRSAWIRRTFDLDPVAPTVPADR